jgi:murein DD-endopeptidase MepM/ murein hydrolase activator NlpD
MSARVGDKFGGRTHPITGRPNTFHAGQDFPAATGTPIYSNKPLIVDQNSYQMGANGSGYGNQILVRDPVTGQQYRMAHLDQKPNWKPGDTIPAGSVVGHVGNTGGSTGSHLHWEVLDNGRPRDPAAFKDSAPVTWDKNGKGNIWNTLDKAKPDPNYRQGNNSVPGSKATMPPQKPGSSSDPIGDLLKRKEQEKKDNEQKQRELNGQDKRNNDNNKSTRPRRGQGITSGSPWHQGHDGG